MLGWEGDSVQAVSQGVGVDNVVWVARNREPGVGLDQIAKDSGIHFRTLYSWMK